MFQLVNSLERKHSAKFGTFYVLDPVDGKIYAMFISLLPDDLLCFMAYVVFLLFIDSSVSQILHQPQLSQSELIAMRSAWSGLDSMRSAMATQGEILVSVTSRMHKAEEEVKHLKRTAS